jgi:RimJ/RimL family protein N-acetyltransferase
MIETARLLLRPMTMADLDEFVALHAIPEITRFVAHFDRSAAIARLADNEREWQNRGHGLVAIIDRATGRFLGRGGLRYWPQFDETEVGWALRPDAWGRGFATEAARACLDWGFRCLDVPYFTAMIGPDNVRSTRVAERLGMTPVRSDALLEVPVVVHAALRDERPARDASPQVDLCDRLPG